MKPIYEPKGAAKEYGDYALNIYTGCPHRCSYCYVPNVLHKDRETFHTVVEPRPGIVEETGKQLERDTTLRGKLIHLCFTCDPYPYGGYDTSSTREIIKILKEYRNHVQILTKGRGMRDFDLLDSEDWYGVTLDGGEDVGLCRWRIAALPWAREKGIRTWISFEPVVDSVFSLEEIRYVAQSKFADVVKIGKLNYVKSDIDWKDFGRSAEAICREYGQKYYIKDSLKKEMQRE